MKTIVSIICFLTVSALAVAQPPQVEPQTAPDPADTVNTRVGQEGQRFVTLAVSGGLFEVQSSQLATTASKNSEIKSFAQKMITDHTKANQELKQLAASKNIPVPTTLDPKHAQMLKRLQSVPGMQFDTIYVRQQKQAHQAAVELFQNAITNVEDQDLKAFATKTLPTLKQHLELIDQLPGSQKPANEPRQDAE